MRDGYRDSLVERRERAVLVACLLPGVEIDPHDPLGELRSLADTAGADVVDEVIQKRQSPDPATFLGSGKVELLADHVRAGEIQLVIFDNDLSPSQIANIEEVVACKVLDRSELILDIFAARARTHEAKLQVELAQLEYTYPRLRAMWSHLERIAGGAPTGIGTRGPGEQQLEIDRRIVQRRKSELKREIARLQGRKQREVERRNQDYFTVGLVGYTNAGKSTLFNALTQGGAYADDKLFATLSTRTRRWELGGGRYVMLSDTVGFVRDLPHHLVASFRATLEEAVHSDLLLIVLDVSHPRAWQQFDTVLGVLDDIGATQQRPRVGAQQAGLVGRSGHVGGVRESLSWERGNQRGYRRWGRPAGRARDRGGPGTPSGGDGSCGHLDHGRAIHFLEAQSQVLERDYSGDQAIFKVRMGSRQIDQLRSLGGIAIFDPEGRS